MVDNEKKFLKLKSRIERCRICQKTFGFEPRPLFWGNCDAKIVQISQAPSLTAYRTGHVWVDKGGEKLKKEWYQIPDDVFHNPSNFFITAIAHCYPGKTKSGDKSPPLVCAKTWLAKELELLKPKLFIVIGGTAAHFLFPKKNFRELVLHNQILQRKPCFVLPHPSPQNIKWFKENPWFEKKRLLEIRSCIHNVLSQASEN